MNVANGDHVVEQAALDDLADGALVREAVGHAGAQQLLGDPLDDCVAGHFARGGVDQRPAHRTPNGVLGERALQQAVNGPLRTARPPTGSTTASAARPARSPQAARARPLHNLSRRDGLCDPQRHAVPRPTPAGAAMATAIATALANAGVGGTIAAIVPGSLMRLTTSSSCPPGAQGTTSAVASPWRSG